MTKKRFIIDDDGIVTDMTDLSMYIDEEDCCEKLNELHDENKELKKENEQLYELLDFANTLFVFKTSESCQKEWEKKLNELIE